MSVLLVLLKVAGTPKVVCIIQPRMADSCTLLDAMGNSQGSQSQNLEDWLCPECPKNVIAMTGPSWYISKHADAVYWQSNRSRQEP